MGCQLRREEIFVLEVLRKSRSLASNRGYHHDKLKKLYSKKFDNSEETMNFDDCIQRLLNRGFIARVGKSPPKYYIHNHREVFIALGECGIDVRPGRFHSL